MIETTNIGALIKIEIKQRRLCLCWFGRYQQGFNFELDGKRGVMIQQCSCCKCLLWFVQLSVIRDLIRLWRVALMSHSAETSKDNATPSIRVQVSNKAHHTRAQLSNGDGRASRVFEKKAQQK